MSDYEEADFFKEPWTSPLKRKSKKVAKKNEKAIKHKKSSQTKTPESLQKKKKKKNFKFKEAMMEIKEKKKERRKEKDKNKKKGKKKKKNKLASNLNDDFKLAEASICLGSCQNEKTNSLSEKSVKEPKRKKMVGFGSLPSYIRIKRPIFNSSPKETEAVREGEGTSQVMGKSQIQPHDNDFQYNSDDVNSQDLFITQKTFRAMPSETSSSEASDRVISESPHVFTQRDKNQHATGEIKQRNETSDKGQDRATHQRHWEIKTEEEEIPSEHEGRSFFLDDPLVINPTPDAVSINHCSSYRPYIGKPLICPALANTSTQTENFFTTELSTYLSFRWKSSATLESQDMKPLDLSLPQRARGDLRLSAKMLDVKVKHKVEKYEEKASLHEGETSSERSESMSAYPQVKHLEVKKEPSCQDDATSPQSEAESKSANMSTSSEDDQHCRAGKRDVTQVGVVQLRLNKPFFFKTKGERQSPRPDSPLMKLAQGRDVKTKKGRSGRI